MTKLHNIKNYKLAKIYSKDLDAIIKETEATLSRYAPYSRYKPVQRIVAVLKDELAVLYAHANNCKKIVESKGQVRPEET